MDDGKNVWESSVFLLIIEEWDEQTHVIPHFQKGPLEDQLQDWVKRAECKSARLLHFRNSQLIVLIENPKPQHPKSRKFH